MLSLIEASAQLRDRKLSSLELTAICLQRIAELNPQLNAFITVTEDLAREQARQVDREIAAGGWRGPLHGIPIALKDLIDVTGVRTTAASRQFPDRIARHDAVIVAKLKTQGAVILGKTNLHEFAFGGSGVISAFGVVRNPWDVTRITGGSSSGSAAAVAAGMCVAAIGTDTAGSIRTPAALCGIVGHRPSAGVWKAEGIIPLRPSFDTVGPMARTVADARILLQALSDNLPAAHVPVSHLRIGIAREGFFDDLDAEVAANVQHAIDVLASLFVSVRDVSVQVKTHWSSFDGEILAYHQAMLDASPELYLRGTRARLMACVEPSPSEYQVAQSALAAERRAALKTFEVVDVVVTPTTVVPAPLIADLQPMSTTSLRAYEVEYLLRNTGPFSLLYWPSVSVPCGFTSAGLPIGMQISARPGADDLALQVAQAYEQATAWHQRVPPTAR
ncbi:MAG TPA: amidase [Candidatus Angelobacter sp.]|nr:amidase [Candidatus Angelobacter sp.]